MRVVSGAATFLSQTRQRSEPPLPKGQLQGSVDMPYVTTLSEHGAEHAIIERLFRASLDVHSALSLVADEPIVCLLRQVIDQLDQSIMQVQRRALDLELHLQGRALNAGAARPRATEPEGAESAGAAGAPAWPHRTG